MALVMGVRLRQCVRGMRVINLRSMVNRKIERLGQWKNILRSQPLRHGIALNKNDRKLLGLRDVCRGKRAFIIGNGPSLNKTDLRLLKNEITIGCNGLFFLFDEMGFPPTYYTVEDTLVAEDRADIINKIRGTTKVFPQDLRYCLKEDEDTVFINFLRRYPGFPRLTQRFETHVYWGGTVTLLNLQLAWYLGVREVYLIGIDHTYQPPAGADEQKGTVIKSHSNDVNHFHPDYFGPGYRYHDPKVERMEQAYEEAKRFFENRGGVIYNATAGGRLEVFPRVSFEAVVGSK
jgi:6-hydroxymethylpterin diphosphokinase MptE-like